MIRMLSISLAVLLLAAPAFAARETRDEIQAPRAQDEIQAPVSAGEIQAPRTVLGQAAVETAPDQFLLNDAIGLARRGDHEC